MADEEITQISDLEAAIATELGVGTTAEAPPPTVTTPDPVSAPVERESPAAEKETPLAPWMEEGENGEFELEEAHTEAESQSTALLAQVKEKFGFDLSSKYRNDDEMLKGLFNAQQRLAQRDEDALYGRLLKQSPQEVYARLREAFEGQQAGQPQPGQQKQEPEEFDKSLFNKVYTDPETGEMKEIEPGALRKIRDYYQQFLKDPDKFLKVTDRVQETVRQELTAFQQQLAQQQAIAQQEQLAQAEAAAFLNQNRWLFNNGDPGAGMSQAGREFHSMFNRVIQEAPHIPQSLQVELAIGRLREQHKPKQSGRPAPRAAQRASKPNLRPARSESPEGVWPEGRTLEDVLLQMQENGEIDFDA